METAAKATEVVERGRVEKVRPAAADEVDGREGGRRDPGE